MTLLLPHEFLTFMTGIGAVACLTGGPLFRGRRAVLAAQLCASICFSVHYLSLGITAAAAMNVLGGVQTLAAIFAGQSKSLNRLCYVLICSMVLSGLLLWQGPLSGVSVLAMALIALGRMQFDQVRMRLLLLAGGFAWIAHDYLTSAWWALAADIGAVVTGLTALGAMFVRIRIEWRTPHRLRFPNAA